MSKYEGGTDVRPTFVRIRAADVPEGNKPDGARLRLIRDEDSDIAELWDEQVEFIERVNNPNAARFLSQTSISLNVNEQQWLLNALTELLGTPVGIVEDLQAEVLRLREYEIEARQLRDELAAVMRLAGQ